MEPNDGVTLIFVTVIGLILIMTDLLVSRHLPPPGRWPRRPPCSWFPRSAWADTGVVNF